MLRGIQATDAVTASIVEAFFRLTSKIRRTVASETPATFAIPRPEKPLEAALTLNRSTPLLSDSHRRFDVRIEAEEVGRVILVLQGYQPFVVGPI